METTFRNYQTPKQNKRESKTKILILPRYYQFNFDNLVLILSIFYHRYTSNDCQEDYNLRCCNSNRNSENCKTPDRRYEALKLINIRGDLRQSFSSSPSPQLSWPLQRKIPGMQRLGWVHLNWLGRHTWMSEKGKPMSNEWCTEKE